VGAWRACPPHGGLTSRLCLSTHRTTTEAWGGDGAALDRQRATPAAAPTGLQRNSSGGSPPTPPMRWPRPGGSGSSCDTTDEETAGLRRGNQGAATAAAPTRQRRNSQARGEHQHQQLQNILIGNFRKLVAPMPTSRSRGHERNGGRQQRRAPIRRQLPTTATRQAGQQRGSRGLRRRRPEQGRGQRRRRPAGGGSGPGAAAPRAALGWSSWRTSESNSLASAEVYINWEITTSSPSAHAVERKCQHPG